MKVGEKLVQLANSFPLRTEYKFLHKTKADLKKKYQGVIMYYVIHDPERGHSLMPWNPRRKLKLTAKEWHEWIEEKGKEIFSEAVLPAINTKSGGEWEIKEYIGFHAIEEFTPVRVLAHKSGDKHGIQRTTRKRISN